MWYLQDTHFRNKVSLWKWEDRQNIHANGNDRKVGGGIIISYKINSKTKCVSRDKEGHHIMIKRSIPKEDITPINICTQCRSNEICKVNINSQKGRNWQQFKNIMGL